MNKSIYQKLVENNVALNDIDTIVHAGAGACFEADFYIELSPKHILLLEADKYQAKSLQNAFQCQHNTTVINKALSASESACNVNFYLTQPAQFSGTEEPLTIKKVFKNLKTLNKTQVPSLTLKEIIEEFAIDPNQKNILVLQVNGAEEQILANVKNEVLKVFNVIVVQVIKSSLQLSLQSERNLAAALLSLNYDLVQSEEHDLIYENHVYVLDKKKQLIEKLQQEVSSLSAQNNNLQADNKSLDEQLLESNTQLKDELAEKQKFQENLAQQTEVVNDFQSKVDVLETTVSEQENKITQLLSSNNEQRESIKLVYQNHKVEKETLEKNTQEKIAEITKQLYKNENSLKEKNAIIEELHGNIATFKTQVKQVTNEHEQLKQWHLENKSCAEDLKKQLEDTTKALDSEKQQSTALKEKLSNTESELQSLKQSYAETKERIASDISELETKINDANAKVKKLHEEKTQLDERLTALTADRDEKNEQFEKHRDWAVSLNKQVEQLTAELAEKSRSTNLGQKMLAKAQVDLAGLRQSYTEKVENEKELVELIKELREKLTLASRYYIKMQQEHPELLSTENDVTSN